MITYNLNHLKYLAKTVNEIGLQKSAAITATLSQLPKSGIFLWHIYIEIRLLRSRFKVIIDENSLESKMYTLKGTNRGWFHQHFCLTHLLTKFEVSVADQVFSNGSQKIGKQPQISTTYMANFSGPVWDRLLVKLNSEKFAKCYMTAFFCLTKKVW